MKRKAYYFDLGDTVYYLLNNRICKGTVKGRKIVDYGESNNFILGEPNVIYFVGDRGIEWQYCYEDAADLLADLSCTIQDVD